MHYLIVSLPVHKGPLCIHDVKLEIQRFPCIQNGCAVGEAAHSSLNLGKVPPWHHRWWLVIDPDFETSGTPVHKPDCMVVLHEPDGLVNIFCRYITPVEHANGHVLSTLQVTFHHLCILFKTLSCYIIHSVSIMADLGNISWKVRFCFNMAKKNN